jgi:hypothetical protein
VVRRVIRAMRVSLPNSALDRSLRSVTPVAREQRARQPVPPVSASVRRQWRLKEPAKAR